MFAVCFVSMVVVISNRYTFVPWKGMVRAWSRCVKLRQFPRSVSIALDLIVIHWQRNFLMLSDKREKETKKESGRRKKREEDEREVNLERRSIKLREMQ